MKHMIKKRVAFHTLGCKLNYSETATIRRSLASQEYEQVGFNDIADVYVINSCSVTRNAEKRCKSLVRKAINQNPSAIVAVLGCFSQINPEELLGTPGVSLVLGNDEKYKLWEHLNHIEKTRSSLRQSITGNGNVSGNKQSEHLLPTTKTPPLPEKFVPTWSTHGRTRSFFKIQDGCDYCCTYCTIPLARGNSRSDTIAGTIASAKTIVAGNIKEIVLSGVNIGDFGRPQGERFIDLLKELVDIDGLERIRISSIEPDLLHDDIIQLVAEHPKLMPHFHIPLQSGSNTVLSAMGRRYDTHLFSQRIQKIRQLMPGACIAVDLIVGFPAETEPLFEESYRFIEQSEVSYLHVFTYSERNHTIAAQRKQQIPAAERNNRSKIMHTLSENKKKAFYNQHLGSTAAILWENEQNKGSMTGFTENYIRVKTAFNPSLTNKIQHVVLNKIDCDGVFIVSKMLSPNLQYTI